MNKKSMEKANLAKRYEILRKIGSGGGGEVYAVLDRFRHQKLALKIFIPEESASIDEAAFFDEFLLALSLSSRYLVKVYDYGYTGHNLPFYTMELLPEQNIDDFLKTKDTCCALSASQGIAAAISFLHFFNLIHNDLKPENIRLLSEQGATAIKLLDFGLTFNFSPDAPKGKLSGTVEYMAPELFESKNPDYRSDLYSLGVIFYRFITAELPFINPDPLVVISDKLEKECPAINANPHSFPQEYLELTGRLLTKEPNERPGSAFEVTNKIAAILENEGCRPAFGEILESAVGLWLSREFAKKRFWQSKTKTFLFHDETLLNHFSRFLQAYLQKDYFNVEIERGSDSSDCEPTVSPNSQKSARIKIHHLQRGETFSADDSLDSISFYLLKAPAIGKYSIDGVYQEINIDLFAVIENWFDSESVTPEFFDKLESLCRENIASLAIMLDEMQAEGILSFDGKIRQVDTERFMDYSVPVLLQQKAIEQIAFLSVEERLCLGMLSILNPGFDHSFILKYLEETDSRPEKLLSKLVDEKILVETDDGYYFRGPILPTALANENDSRNLKGYFLRAATILENAPGVDPVRRIMSLARNYTLAGKLDDSVKWTLKAADFLISKTKYRAALKFVNNSLKLADKSSLDPYVLGKIAALMAARGDIENKLGLIRDSLTTFAAIIKMKKKIEDQEVIARAYKHIGDIYKANRDYRRGLKALQKALDIYQKLDNKVEISHTYNNIGNIYWVGAEHDRALESYFAALKIQETLGVSKDIASTLGNLGGCYYQKHQYEKSIEYTKRAIEIKKQINDWPELARSYNNLGAIYHQLGDIPEALKYLYDSLKINKEIDSSLEVLFNLENIASCEITLGHYQQADALLKEQLELSERLDNEQFQASAQLHRGIIDLRIGEYSKAENSLNEVRNRFTSAGDHDLEHLACLHLANLHYDLNQPDLFWEYIEKALDAAVSTQDKTGAIYSLMLKGRGYVKFQNNPAKSKEILAQCFQIINEISFKSPLCEIYLTELRLSQNIQAFPEDKLNALKQLISQPSNQILKPRFLYYLAKGEIAQKNPSEAKELLFESAILAEKYGQVNLLWRIKYLQGNVECLLMNYEEAYISYKKAVTLLKTLAQKLTNQDYLKSLLRHPKALDLKQKIMELASRMG